MVDITNRPEQIRSKIMNQSHFDSVIAKLSRIDVLHKKCHEYRITKNYALWYQILLALKNELLERLTDDEKKQILDLAVKTARSIEKYEEQTRYNISALQRNNPVITLDPDYYLNLDSLEALLFELEYKHKFTN